MDMTFSSTHATGWSFMSLMTQRCRIDANMPMTLQNGVPSASLTMKSPRIEKSFCFTLSTTTLSVVARSPYCAAGSGNSDRNSAAVGKLAPQPIASG